MAGSDSDDDEGDYGSSDSDDDEGDYGLSADAAATLLVSVQRRPVVRHPEYPCGPDGAHCGTIPITPPVTWRETLPSGLRREGRITITTCGACSV